MKVRGFRIELREVELVLAQHPGVRQVVVLEHEDEPGNKSLVSYILPHRKSPAKVSDLRHFLKGRVPEYMIPSAFVVLETLPLTPNGKIDRKALKSTRPATTQHLINKIKKN